MRMRTEAGRADAPPLWRCAPRVRESAGGDGARCSGPGIGGNRNLQHHHLDHRRRRAPDISTSFTLRNPGAPEAAKNVIFNAPEGLFGNPYAVTHCTSSDFALDQCPSDSQIGLITVYSNFPGTKSRSAVSNTARRSATAARPLARSPLPIKVLTEVSAEATGLATGTTYHYRVHAIDVRRTRGERDRPKLRSKQRDRDPARRGRTVPARHSAHLRRRSAGHQTALFAFIVPDPEHSDQHSRRGAHRRRLRPPLHRRRHHPGDPSGRRQSRPSGASRPNPATMPSASPKAPWRTGQLPGSRRHELPWASQSSRASRCIRSPTTRPPAPEPLTASLTVQTYQDPEHPTHRTGELSGDDRAAIWRSSTPFSTPVRPPNETDSPSGLNIELSAPQFLGRAASPSEIKNSDRHPAGRLHDQPRRRRRSDRLHRRTGQLRLRGPGQCPDNSKIGTFSIGTQALPGRLEGVRLYRRTEARQPVPPLPDRLRLRDQRQARRLVQARTP